MAETRDTPRGARPLADLIGRALAPAARRRGFAAVDLVTNWPDIIGPDYAGFTQPEKLTWPRRPVGIEEEHEPATLVLRCTGAMALRLTHELPQVIERINMFFGFRCVSRIKLVQLPVARPEEKRRRRVRPVGPEDSARVSTAAAGIADDALRGAVERLGLAIAADTPPLTKS